MSIRKEFFTDVRTINYNVRTEKNREHSNIKGKRLTAGCINEKKLNRDTLESLSFQLMSAKDISNVANNFNNPFRQWMSDWLG